MTKHKYSKEQLEVAIQKSQSITQVLKELKIVEAGGNYSTIKKLIQKYNLDISHFSGKLWNKGKTIGPKRPIEDYLLNKYSILSHKLKLRLIKENIFKHECSICKLSEWQNKPIPIELDHINGNHSDNTLSNLRLLCPNCHAQTENYRGKNKNRTGPT